MNIYCKRCGQVKPEEDFPKNKSKPSGRGFYCNACMYERLKEWRKANPGKVKSIAKRRYEKLNVEKLRNAESDKIHGEAEVTGYSLVVSTEVFNALNAGEINDWEKIKE